MMERIIKSEDVFVAGNGLLRFQSMLTLGSLSLRVAYSNIFVKY